MDPIKNRISATDPMRNDPAVPDGEAALHRMLTEPAIFSDSLPPNVTSLEDRKRRRARLVGVLTLAAAAVTAGLLVATNLGALTTAPAPASTVSGLGTASSTASPTPTPSVTATPIAAPAPSGAPAPTPTPAATGNGECTIENVQGVQSWVAEKLQSLQVSGCAGDWMALNADTVGGQTGPGSFFWMAKLSDGKYIVDAEDPSANIPGWDQANANNERLTAEQFMDGQFAAKGIPVELRKALVGAPAPGSLAGQGIKTYVDWPAGYKVSFNYPAAWQLADASLESSSLANGAGTSLTDATGTEVARLAHGDANDWSTSGCLNTAPYKVLDSQPMPGLPVDPATPEQGTPRFVYVAMTSAAGDGGPVQAGIGITNRISGQDGIGCVLDLAVRGPDALEFYSFGNRRPLGGSFWGLYNFQTMEEALAFSNTQDFEDLKAVITSLTVTRLN